MGGKRTLNQDFFKNWTPEMAYVLGYFAADGSMLKNSRGGYYIEFTSTDRILLEHVKNSAGANQKISKRVRDARDKPVWKTTYRIQIGSKEWFDSLTMFGFTQHKSKSLRFPQVPAEVLGSFVRGYFDGDGCVYFGEHFSKWHGRKVWVFTTIFTSGCRDFLEVLHEKLKKQGVLGGRIGTKKRGYELVLSRHDSLALYRLMYHTAKVARLYLPRKRDKLEKAIQVLGLDK